MESIVIRAHRPTDRPFLRRMLEAAAVPTYPDLQKLGRLTRGERLDDIFEAHYVHDRKRIWVAEAPGERPAGMIWLVPSIHPVTEIPDWLVVNVAVAPEFQRLGIGRRLMHHARDFCLADGVRHMRLFVGAHNESAYHLYRTLGFETQTHEMRWEF